VLCNIFKKEGKMPEKISIKDVVAQKKSGKKITMLTAYDYPLATLVDKAGVDIILVGDSLANVVLGLKSTKEVGMDEMIHHAKAVRRGVHHALLVVDMPYEAYQLDIDQALDNAARLMHETGCDAVKIEWFDKCLEVTQRLVQAGIPVMGHLGLTPQTADRWGGFKVQGRDLASAQKIMEQARALEDTGCFSIVLECIPRQVAAIISDDLSIPTIGIGAGAQCDGQVLVTPDLLGLIEGHKPKFVKQYLDGANYIMEGLQRYCSEVRSGAYPDPGHSYSMIQTQAQKADRCPLWFKSFLRAIARGMLYISRTLIRIMPYWMFKVFVFFFIGLGHCLMLKKRNLALVNLQKAFKDDKSPQELRRIAQDCFNGFGKGMVEVIYYADRAHLLPQKVTIEGQQHLDKALKGGHGAVLVSAHFGNFLLMYFRMIVAGYKTNVIMRRVRDERFEKYISDFRNQFGLKTIYDLPARKCVQESLRALRHNEILFILLDQNYGTDGRVFVDFFGQKAATAAGPVVFSCRTQAPILPIFIKRQEDDTHKIVIEPPVPLVQCGDEQENIVHNVAKLTKIIEDRIRENPHMWGGWMHKRWKSRTVEEQSLLDKLQERLQKESGQ